MLTGQQMEEATEALREVGKEDEPPDYILQVLVEPIVQLDPLDHRRAQLLAGLLLSLIALGLVVGLVQLLVVRGFGGTFIAMACALAVLCVAYWASRTQHYRASAMAACVAPVAACTIVAVMNPNDPVWFAFMLLGVIFATLFFSVRQAAAIAGCIFSVLCALIYLLPKLHSPERFIPILGLHVVLSPLLLLAAHHHRLMERDRQRELRRRDLRLTNVQHMEAFGEIAGGVAHDFNNLVTVINDQVRQLEGESAPAALRKLADIRYASDKATALGRQLIAFARRQHSELEELDLGDVVHDLHPLLTRMAGHSVRVLYRYDPRPFKVTAERLQIEQVLMNLVINARDAMPDGGDVTIEIENVELDTLYCERHPGARPGAHVAVAVGDTGVGMDEATRARAFEPFFTTKHRSGGTGLGLATVLRIANQHGGHATVSSEVGRGSTLRIYLPSLARRSQAR